MESKGASENIFHKLPTSGGETYGSDMSRCEMSGYLDIGVLNILVRNVRV